MNSREKGQRNIPPMIIAALGTFLVAAGGIPTAGLFPVVMRAEMPAAAAPQAALACKIIMDANDRLFSTPYHMYMTQVSMEVENGNPITTETIFVGGAQYVLVKGRWGLSPVSVEELKAMEAVNRKTSRMTCHFVRDETVNGEAAALYTSHGESAHASNENQIWISRSKGLILRQETDLFSNRTMSKTHLSVRYEYTNVRAPKL